MSNLKDVVLVNSAEQLNKRIGKMGKEEFLNLLNDIESFICAINNRFGTMGEKPEDIALKVLRTNAECAGQTAGSAWVRYLLFMYEQDKTLKHAVNLCDFSEGKYDCAVMYHGLFLGKDGKFTNNVHYARLFEFTVNELYYKLGQRHSGLILPISKEVM